MTAPNEFLILLFHSVDDGDRLSLRDLGNVRPEAFEKTIVALKKEFDIINLEDTARFISEGKGGPDRPLAITFDDGAKTYASCAVPIMEVHGVPSACFLITDCVGDKKIYWRYLYNYCVHSGRSKKLEALVKEEYDVRTLEGGVIRFSRNNFSNAKTKRIVKRILTDVASEEEYREREGPLFLSFEDLESLKDNPFVTLGIHTLSHPVMKGLTDEEIRDEIAGSLDFYRQWIGDSVPMFSVPFGRLYRDYDERTVNTARHLSVKVILSAYGGGNSEGQPLYNFRRIPVREDMLKEGLPSFVAHLGNVSSAVAYREAEARLCKAAEGRTA